MFASFKQESEESGMSQIERDQALKTICGGVYHMFTTYKKYEILDRDWEMLCSYLKSTEQVYCVEMEKKGFVITTRSFRLRYVHSDFAGRTVNILFRA
jgi:hypothetical protein